MRKLKLFFSMLMLIAFSVGNVWAADYQKTALADITSSDVVIIVGNNGSLYALSNDKGTGSAPAAVSVSATNDVITTDATNILWNIAKDGNNLTIYPNGTTETWLYCTATNNGVRVGTSANKVFVIDNTNNSSNNAAQNDYLYNSATNRWLGVYNSSDWRCYTTIGANIKNQALSFYVLQEESGDDVTVKTLKSIALSGQTTSFYQNAAFAFDGTCTATYSVTKNDVAQADEQKVVTPTSVSSPDMTTLGNKEVTVTFTDGEVSKEAKYTITVTEAPAAVNYEKVTAEPADWSGEYILVYEADATNARVWKGADEANNYAEATIATGVIAAPEGAAVLTIAKVAESNPVVYTIMVGDKYIGQTSDANGIKIQTTAINNSISYNGTDAAVDIVASSAHLRYNSASSSYFRYYKSATYSSQKKIQLYKKVEGTVKPAAGLAYAEADLKKLAKLGDAFTAPTLQNPNSLAVSYASNNTDVAEVAANGAVTIKAAGVAVITASFAGNDDYKAGSASYTIGVTAHAGTETDPYVAADAKIAIDVMGTVENAYATGVVSKVVTSTLPAEGYITFDFSADGTTTSQQIQAYKCKSLNGEAFSALTDVETGATVVVTGNLKKFNSTYEFDANCHLISYEAPAVPKTHIANDQANPYTVAQAIAYAADGVTYDLDDYVYVRGVVYDVKSFNDGVMNIFIKDANAENQFELFKCAGINDGNSTTPFEALTDVQAGNIVIGYGQLTVFNSMSELKQGNYLVDLQKPVTGIELDATAEVEAGLTVNLTATILPSNATGTIVWSVESGDDYASVDGGVVTGIAEGEAVIRATVQGTEIYAECTVTVSAAPVLTDYYEKVTATENITDGTYLIVYEGDNLAFNGGLETLDAASNTIDVTIVGGNKIGVTESTAAATFFLDVDAGTIQSKSGNYIGVSSNSNGLKQTDDAATYTHTFSIDADGNAVIAAAFEGSTMTLRYNSANNQARFRYYKDNGQQAIQLYKLANEVVKASPELAWTGDVDITLDETFTTPTLSHADGFTGAITYSSDNEELATVNENGVISLVADATGTAVITASFAGNDDYKAMSATCTITVNATAPTPAETKNVVIIAEYNSKFYAMTTTLDNKAFKAVEVEKDGEKIVVFAEADKEAIQWKMTDNTTTATFQDADDKYMAHTGTGTDLTLQENAESWTWNETNQCYYMVVNSKDRALMYYKDGIFKNYAISNLAPDKTDYSGAPEIIEIAAENIVLSTKEDPELAFNPEEVTLTVGGEFTPATLTYVEGFDGLADVTLESSNTSLAVVNEGVVSLVENATGTATITATFAGNNNYLAGTASYTITVNEAGDDLSGSWVLATAVPAVGQKFIIAGTYQGTTMTIGEQRQNNRAAVASTLEDDVLTPGAGTKVFTLVDAGDGKFAIQASNGKYLYAAGGSSNNHLKEADDYEAVEAKWTITIENGVASVISMSEGDRNALRYNSTSNSELFSCYKSTSQRDIALYVQDTYTRTLLEPNHYYTVCLPKKMMEVRGASFWKIENRDKAGTKVYLEEVDPTEFAAGTPFIIQATATALEVVYTGSTTTTAGTNGALRGTLVDMSYAELQAKGEHIYLLIQDAIRPIASSNYLNANRAYIDYDALTGVSSAPMGAPGRRVRAMPMQGQVATGIDALNTSDAPAKVLINGQLFILRGEKMYDVQGQLVK